ncbi:MAG: ImmA/IrrE family metallo-endopeptidase [Cloacibacillus sp.]
MLPGNNEKFFDEEISVSSGCGEIEEFPLPPESIPQWAAQEAAHWQRLGEFELLAEAEERTGLTLELKYADLPSSVWGIHLVRRERGRIFINTRLPLLWRRFAIFHELYHLLNDTKGAKFWSHACVSMESFENRADLFAWAALWPEWEENQYCDWN